MDSCHASERLFDSTIVSSALPEFFSCARLGCGVGDLIDCYPMVGGKEGVKLAATGCESKGVRALFGGDASKLLHVFVSNTSMVPGSPRAT
jgi:hypothetical protein